VIKIAQTWNSSWQRVDRQYRSRTNHFFTEEILMKLFSNIIHFHHELGLKRTIDVFAQVGFEAIDFNFAGIAMAGVKNSMLKQT